MGKITAPQPLSEKHVVEGFDCGNGLLDDWLKKYALANSRANAAKTFVVCVSRKVVGYYSLAMGSVDYEEATPRIKKGLARHPIPVVVLGRLAVDLRHQDKRLGISLLKDALLRALTVSEHIGARAVFVNAKDENAKNFYEKHGFSSLPGDTLKLIILIKDIKKIIESASIKNEGYKN
jgi:predicted N-acetyltransferase YhbS